MKITLRQMTLTFRKATEVIPLSGFRYFYGPIGSGKSSIGRLIDFCVGGEIELTPALQQEFQGAALDMTVAEKPVRIERARNADAVFVTWGAADNRLQVILPARVADGEVLPETGVEVLSDLLFFIAGERPPKVRRRRGTPEERLERLSFRDLFRFCYLEQRWMDSDFYRLGSDNYPIRQKSVDTLRYVLGYATEKVADLESELQAVREARQAASAAADSLSAALTQAGFDDLQALVARAEQIRDALIVAEQNIRQARQKRGGEPHGVDTLRQEARGLSLDIDSAKDALSEMEERKEAYSRQRNEIQMLTVKAERLSAAQEVLSNVEFKSCPRCSQQLPHRPAGSCHVCAQDEVSPAARHGESASAAALDIKARSDELDDAVQRLDRQIRETRKRVEGLLARKKETDLALSVRLEQYDSAFLSNALELERRYAALKEESKSVERFRRLPDIVSQQRAKASELMARELSLKRDLEEARGAAFNDRRNVDKLGDLFLDCLLRTKFPDVEPTAQVILDASNFYPRIPLGKGALLELTFDNAGSGGMMALFKACFALALHRLAADAGSMHLPTVLIIDTPTKNVSSKENPEVIKAFFHLIYELAATELHETQFVVIENEFTAPATTKPSHLAVRHMVRGDPKNPPLIPYLAGDFE